MLVGNELTSILDEDSVGYDANCTHGIQWIWSTFGQCVENSLQYSAFIIGFVSFLLWLLPVLPQIYQNYKRGHCDDALSIYFLLFWFLGDSLNLSGAILSNQLPIQIYIGFYFIFQDCVILTQYFYYKIRGGWHERMLRDLGPPTLSCVMILGVLSCANSFGVRFGRSVDAPVLDGNNFIGRKLLHLPFFKSEKDEIGYVFGTVSALCYLCGRVPQLYKNCVRRSTEGVSLLMFYIIIVANITYGLSVLLSGDDLSYFLHHLPWLLGSFGCCFLDTIVILQHFAFKKRAQFEMGDEERSNIIENGKIDEQQSTDDTVSTLVDA